MTSMKAGAPDNETTDAGSDSNHSDETKTTMGPTASASGAPTAAQHADDNVKIICVGVMRTGLKTLHRALRNLGYSNIYDQEDIVSCYDQWNDVLRNKASSEAMSSMFKGREVIMGMPTFCFWEQIVEMYPNAKVILTIRDEDDWWGSVQRAKKLMDNELPGSPLRYGSIMRAIEKKMVPSYHKFCEVLRFAWNTTLGAQGLSGEELNEVAARSSYRKHNSYVKTKLSDTKGQLLVYDVRQGWEPLCEFLGKDTPEIDFPKAMTVAYFPGAHEEKPDCCELSELMLPQSDFGVQMRTELRRGLAVFSLALTLFVGLLVAFQMLVQVQLPMMFVALVYVGIITIGWVAYVLMHGLVTRVPALLVVPMAMKSLMIAGALHACFLSYGILKEMLVTKDKVASPVLVLSSRLMAIICGAIAMLLADGKISFGTPLSAMSAFAFTNEASTWAGYEMLKYVSFPVQVMAKSCKMLPNMLMGRALNGTQYSLYQYGQAVAALVCVTIMHFADEHADDKKGKGKHAQSDDVDPYYNLMMGVFFLIFFFASDSFTSQWQTSLYKKYPNTSQTQMMLGGNLLGFFFTSGSLVFNWAKISKSMGNAMEHPEIMGRIIMLGVVSALGQFCIYSAIRILGPLSFTWIMTARQLLSVLISLLFFGHGINVTKLACIMTVFAIMSSKQLSKIMPKNLPCKKRSESSLRRLSTLEGFHSIKRWGTTGFYAPKEIMKRAASGSKVESSKKDA